MKFVEKIDMWESIYEHKRREYVLEAVKWIVNKYSNTLRMRLGLGMVDDDLIHQLFQLVLTIKQSDIYDYSFINHHQPEIVHLKSSINKLGRSFYSHKFMTAVVVPRSYWTTYNRKKTKRFASRIPFQDYRCAVMVPTIHELTHYIQHIRDHKFGEVETTINEVEFIKSEYPEMYKLMDKNYYDEVEEINTSLYNTRKFAYKTYSVVVNNSNIPDNLDLEKINPDIISWERRNDGHVFGDYILFNDPHLTYNNFKYTLFRNDEYVMSFQKKGDATLFLAITNNITNEA